MYIIMKIIKKIIYFYFISYILMNLIILDLISRICKTHLKWNKIAINSKTHYNGLINKQLICLSALGLTQRLFDRKYPLTAYRLWDKSVGEGGEGGERKKWKIYTWKYFTKWIIIKW